MRRIGVHVSIAGGVQEAVERAHALGCSAFQIFTHNPRGWALTDISQSDAAAFKNLRAKYGIGPVFVHCSYLVNLASAELRDKSTAMLIEEMRRADFIGAEYVILHAPVGDETVQVAISALKKVSASGKWRSGLLLENTAGTKDFTGISEIARKSKGLVKGICLDTCHAFAAGYDIRTKDGALLLRAHAEKAFPVKVIHLNDSKADVGSAWDRHEHIGKGKIGIKGFKEFLKSDYFPDVPLILETPKETDDDDKANLRAVRRLLKAIF